MTEPLTGAPVAPYPVHPGDLFVTIYDELPDLLFRGWEVQDWHDDRSVHDLAHEIEKALLDYGELHPDDVADLINKHGDRGRFAILLGIDDALQYVSPYAPYSQGYSGILRKVVGDYHKRQQLNTPATPGLLLPRRAFPCRPIAKREKDEFFNLHRITAEQCEVVEHTVLRSVLDVAFGKEDRVRVGCAPMLESYEDIEIEFGERGGVTTYALRPADTDRLRDRIERVVRELDAAGVQIAVLPEATLTDELLEHWKQVAYGTARYDREAHPLRYLLVGSGPIGGGDPPPNRAVLIERWTKEEILVHDKLAWFTMEKDRHLEGWHIPGAPERGPAEEYIRQGDKIRTLDFSLGRLSILICEDLGRPIRWERELRACGVSHLLVPIFSKPIFKHRWEEIATGRPLISLGSWVIISNSRAVGQAIPRSEMKGTRYTCLVAGPDKDDKGRLTYNTTLQFGSAQRSDLPGRVKVTTKGGGGTVRVLPTVEPGVLQPEWRHAPKRRHPPRP